MLLLGIDLGTSSVKVAVIDAATQQCLAAVHFPETEQPIISAQPGWAEQSPEEWWSNIQQAILKCNATGKYRSQDIGAIGIAYQMHGLVLINKKQQVLRNSIIWCDSRAVSIGDIAYQALGSHYCLPSLLNSPGNFTASKLAWVKNNEPVIYEQIDKIMLPGDFVAMKFTGECTTTISALSEGVFWDFQQNNISHPLCNYFGFDSSVFPELKPLFSNHGYLKSDIASSLSLASGIPVSYKAGDQPNNALSLNVLEPGDVAATAGTSGVIYGVSETLCYDTASRINSFAHVNHQTGANRIGVLLCINGAGIFNKWMRQITGPTQSYHQLNQWASATASGADGLLALPFGNGAERMLENRMPGAQFHHLDFNRHTSAHMVRAVQEGIAFAFRYGLDIMRANGMHPSVIRAAKTNMFLSDVFTQAFASVNEVEVEFFEGDGSYGAAIGAGIGAGVYKDALSACSKRIPVERVYPEHSEQYNHLYGSWKEILQKQL